MVATTNSEPEVT